MSDKTYNIAEALTVIYKLMIDVDGENQDGEVEAVVELIQKYADHVEQDIGSVVDNALALYRSQTVEQNFEFATNVASNLNQFFAHETLVLIAQDLAKILDICSVLGGSVGGGRRLTCVWRPLFF